MKVLFAAAECAPFFKTGGLGDVISALPKALQDAGEEVQVVLPFYRCMPERYQEQCQDLLHFDVCVGWRRQYCGVKFLNYQGLKYYFIDNRYYFDRPQLYGDYDDGERFAFFQQALLELLPRLDFTPEVLHLNDYHTAMIPFLLKEKYYWQPAFRSLKTVLTIHNIAFQGQYDANVLPDLFGMSRERYDDGTLRYNDCLNFMKAGILYADRVTTVSPSYAEEIKTPAFGSGLDVILRMESGKLSGILNGIDIKKFDPAADKMIFENFDREQPAQKIENKVQLQKVLGLPVRGEVPLIGIVSRLTHQKGFQLLLAEMAHLLQFDLQLVVLGTGDFEFEQGFRYFGERCPEKVSVHIGFDLNLAQRIYAGADLFLMPSAFEPCGLSQMIAMRYGTLPVVHETGGLKDTVMPYDPTTKKGEGFGFQCFHSFYLMEALKQGLQVYREQPQVWRKLMAQAMAKDFSWQQPAASYQGLYRSMQF